MVMEAGDLDLDSSSSDSEDQDESESLFEGHARVIWTSLAETIEKIDDILVVDRAFLHGDTVASVSDPSGQTGTVINVELLVDLKAPDGEIIRNVDSKNLVRVRAFEVGDYVIRGPWLGRVEEVDQNVIIIFDDNAKCKIRKADSEYLIPIPQNPLEDEDYAYYPGQRVRVSSSTVFKNARWLQGKWKAGCIEGIISKVEVGSIYVNWIASALPESELQPATAPLEEQDPRQLTILSCFSYANWQLGDWCLLPPDGEQETIAEESLKSYLRSSTKDVLHQKKHCRSPIKYDKTLYKKEEITGQAMLVVNTKTKVDVIWQDGTHSFCLDSRTLFPVDNLGDHDFWPEQYVLEKGQDEDGGASTARRIGVVKNVDSNERTVRVKWLNPAEHPEDPHEFDKEEVVSVYELADHPDYNYCIGDIVIRISSIRGTLVESHIVNHFGQEEDQNNLDLEKNDVSMEPDCGKRALSVQNVRGGGCSKESYLSFIGYIIGLKDGDVEVVWADGTISKVGPQDITVVASDEEEDSTQSISEEDSEDDEDDAVRTEIVDADGAEMNEKKQQVDKASSTQIDTQSRWSVADREHEIKAEESSNDGGVPSISQAAFGFIARVTRGLLGFRGSKIFSRTTNTNFQGEPAQIGVFQEKASTRDSQNHLPESATMNSADGLKTTDDSVAMLRGKEESPPFTSKDKVKDADCKVEHQGQIVRESLNDSGRPISNTVKKQKKDEDYLLDAYDPGNDKSFKQFDSVNDPVEHFFLNKTSQSISQHQWIKKVQQEWTILQNNLPDTIYVRAYEDRMDLLRAAIIGAAGTPYQDGLFFFDIHLPSEYPRVPPSVHYHSGGLRLNPNLYEDGKVCLSLLNTWTGRGNEVWDPVNSSILQVLVSIQGLVLNEKPYFNEAGYDRQIGRAEAEKNSVAYNENSFLLSCKTMLYLLRKPPKHFESFVKEHFHKHGRYILAACNAYMEGAQVGSLTGEAVMPLYERTDSQLNSSHGFKLILAKLIPKLVSAFNEVGADCAEFLEFNV